MKSKIGLQSVLNTAFSQALPGNSSDPDALPATSFSPTTLLESFIPGYGPIHKFLLFTFGFDVSIFVSLIAIIWLGTRVGNSVWSFVWKVISDNWMAEVNVSSTDEIHGHLIQYLAHQYKTQSARRLMAETPSKSAWELDSEEPEILESKVDKDGNIKWLNFSNQEAKSQPRFTPAIGSHNFWHQGTFFRLRRREVAIVDQIGGGGGATAFKDKEVLTLSCFGRSPEPIKKLIQHAKVHYHLGHNAKTIIKRPAPKDMRRFGGRGSWLKIAERPCRPMTTVVLDDTRKADVLNDINEYLNPATARWYANRGIPYRRGYLFYGPPGTGKTSLTFALAGVFGLDIHVVSLLEPTLTEEELGMLFTNLPARCIVLLEDIDTAGLVRNDPAADEEIAKVESTAGTNDLNVVSLTKAIKKANEQAEEERKKGISLSGLLNIIDGVASHEGRVLVMTTNRPEKLDEALIRPGRVDHQVAFGNATQHQIKELFERMYTNDLPTAKLVTSPPQLSIPAKPNGPTHRLAKIINNNNNKGSPDTPATLRSTNNLIHDNLTPPSTPITSTTPSRSSCELEPEVDADADAEDLAEIAFEFSRKIPNDLFSPAEIQGFLLKRKTDPRKALLEVDAWVRGMLEQKQMGTKLVRVQ